MLDYGIGNLRSAAKALQRCGADARLIDHAPDAAGAAGVVLPGVGAFGSCARALKGSGLEGVAREAAGDGRPFLGICVGMQLLYEGSEEAPGEAGLGVLEGTVYRLRGDVKRPQMQWNRLELRGDGPLVRSLRTAGGPQPWVYFVHSYAPPPGGDVVATCDYGEEVVSAVQRGSLWATQFHPEKSGWVGLGLLAGFVAECGGTP